jgi:poly(A)-specific ribonuclease
MNDITCKVLGREQFASEQLCGIKAFPFLGLRWIHSDPFLKVADKVVEPLKQSEKSATAGSAGDAKVKRKKLKGKRAVVKWLKFFRWKKKKNYERMTAEEKILFNLRKVRSIFALFFLTVQENSTPPMLCIKYRYVKILWVL